MVKANCLCSSFGFGIMSIGCFTINARTQFKINSKLVRLSRNLSLNFSLVHSKYSVVQNDFWLVRCLFYIFGYFLSSMFSHCSTNTYEIKAITSSSSLLWDWEKVSQSSWNSAPCNLRLSNFGFKKCRKFAFAMFHSNPQALLCKLFIIWFFLSTFYQT